MQTSVRPVVYENSLMGKSGGEEKEEESKEVGLMCAYRRVGQAILTILMI